MLNDECGMLNSSFIVPRSAFGHWLLVIGVALLAFGAVAWRVDRAPDVFTDEILYTRAGVRVAGEGALVWDNGEPLFVHPPLYFLVEAGYFLLRRPKTAASHQSPMTTDLCSLFTDHCSVFAWVYHTRYLNAALAGLTAAVLYWPGRWLRSPGLGLLLALLLTLDPFGVRINRRAMLETLAMLLTLAGMTVLLTGGERPRPARAMVAGLLLGLALLTKEITFTAPLAVLLFGVWEHRRRQGDKETRRQGDPLSLSPSLPLSLSPFLPVIVAGLTYSLFPLWALTTGRWDRFLHVKGLSLTRLLGLVQLSGWNRPGVSLTDFLLRRLTDYGSSYLLLALGGVATLWLLLRHRHDRAGRLLGVWGLVLYSFYAFTALAGTANDQFFYFLLVPAMLFLGYAATGTTAGKVIAALFLLLVLPYNAARWWTAYGVGVDDGYRQLKAYVDEHLPLDEPLNASGDAIKFKYFFPNRPITDAATPEEARAESVHYFVLAPKDMWARYGRTSPELAAWIMAEGQQLFAVEGDSYGEIFLYRVEYPDARSPVPQKPRTLPPAKTGFVAPFMLALGGWLGTLTGLSLVQRWWIRTSDSWDASPSTPGL